MTIASVLEMKVYAAKNKFGLPIGRADMLGREVAIQLTRGNWDGAKAVVDKAANLATELADADRLDMPLEDVGVEVTTASIFARAGYYTARDLLGKQIGDLVRLKQINKHRAGQIIRLVNRLEAEDIARRQQAKPDRRTTDGYEDEFNDDNEEV